MYLEKIFLEDNELFFSEEQQCFHFQKSDDKRRPSNQYFLIMDNCNTYEIQLLKSFLYRSEKNGIKGEKSVKYRTADVLEAVNEVKGFIKNLNSYSMGITSEIKKEEQLLLKNLK